MRHELEATLRAEGFPCRVEVRERLVILIPDHPGDGDLTDPVARTRVQELARHAGFSHVALELDTGGATLPRA